MICRHVITLTPSELLSLSVAASDLRLEDPVLCPLIEQQVHHHMNSSSDDPGQISKVLEGMVKGKHHDGPSGEWLREVVERVEEKSRKVSLWGLGFRLGLIP